MEVLVDQALPKLVQKHSSKRKPGIGALAAFFRNGGTWREIFDASDIGAERNLIAGRFATESARILDVGCGRGYFSFACAEMSARVTSVDLMDGGGRAGWWDEFKKAAAILGHARQISGVRASATSVPLKRGSVQLVASVHSIRNFGSIDDIRGLVREANRILAKGGRLVVVESDLEDPESPGYRAFYSMRAKMGWELDLPTCDGVARFMEVGGFADVSQEFVETNLEYAPIRFPYDQSRAGMREEYTKAEKLLKDEAEKPPRICLTSGIR